MAPGIQYPLVCWGAGQPKGKETLTKQTKKVPWGKQSFEYIDYVGDYGRVRETDIWEEAVEKGNIVAGEPEPGEVAKSPVQINILTPIVVIGLLAAGWFAFG